MEQLKNQNQEIEQFNKDLGLKIRALRKQRKISQLDLANKTGVAQSTLARIEKGSRMAQNDTLLSIAKGLDVEIYELYIFDKGKTKKQKLDFINKILDKHQDNEDILTMVYNFVEKVCCR